MPSLPAVRKSRRAPELPRFHGYLSGREKGCLGGRRKLKTGKIRLFLKIQGVEMGRFGAGTSPRARASGTRFGRQSGSWPLPGLEHTPKGAVPNLEVPGTQRTGTLAPPQAFLCWVWHPQILSPHWRAAEDSWVPPPSAFWLHPRAPTHEEVAQSLWRLLKVTSSFPTKLPWLHLHSVATRSPGMNTHYILHVCIYILDVLYTASPAPSNHQTTRSGKVSQLHLGFKTPAAEGP